MNSMKGSFSSQDVLKNLCYVHPICVKLVSDKRRERERAVNRATKEINAIFVDLLYM